MCLVEVREGDVVRRTSSSSTGGDVEKTGGEVEVRLGSHGTGGKVKVVRDEVWLGVVAPGSLAVAGVGQLVSLQPVVLVLPASGEGQRPAEVWGEVGDGGGEGGGEGPLHTAVQTITGGGVVTGQVRTTPPLHHLSCTAGHGEPAFILLGAVPLEKPLKINSVLYVICRQYYPIEPPKLAIRKS